MLLKEFLFCLWAENVVLFLLIHSNTFSNALLSVLKKIIADLSLSTKSHKEREQQVQASTLLGTADHCSTCGAFLTVKVFYSVQVYGAWWLHIWHLWGSRYRAMPSYPSMLQLSLVQMVTAKEDLQVKLGFACDWKINCTQTPLSILGLCYSYGSVCKGIKHSYEIKHYKRKK